MATRKRTHAPTDAITPSPAAELIARRLADPTIAPMPSDAAIAELKKILAHNDASPPGYRVGDKAVIDMLQGMGWQGKSKNGLNGVCRRLGRKSFRYA